MVFIHAALPTPHTKFISRIKVFEKHAPSAMEEPQGEEGQLRQLNSDVKFKWKHSYTRIIKIQIQLKEWSPDAHWRET